MAPGLKDRLDALHNDPNFVVERDVTPDEIHRRLLDDLPVAGDAARSADYSLISYRVDGQPSLQTVVAIPPAGSGCGSYADFDLDRADPLQDVRGFAIHMGELLSGKMTDHFALLEKAGAGDGSLSSTPSPTPDMPHDYYILVLGDSVPWGQGLLEPQKMHALVRDAVAAQQGPTRCLQMAHSGAVIGVDSGGGPAAACDGEVPTSFPTIVQQCEAAPDTRVDLVILNGGINDIDIRYILNPFTERNDLADVTRRFCGTDMSTLLDCVLARFPVAKVIVTAYYPVLSSQSHLPLVDDFMLTLGMPVAPLTRFIDANLIFDRIVENAALFYEESTAALRAAVDAANAAAPGRAVFAAPAFTDDNAALAPDAWLFGIHPDLSPEDPAAAARHVSCDKCLKDWLRREQCYRASAGHPNVIGARKFADAILAAR